MVFSFIDFLGDNKESIMLKEAASPYKQWRDATIKPSNFTFVPDWAELNLNLNLKDEDDIRLAWAIGCTLNSNTITLVKGGMLIGHGVGQQDRVGCCELALKRARDAGHDPQGAVAYSDSFFPFPDGPEVLAKAGIRAIFATSGSVNNDKTRALCEQNGVRLYMLPDSEACGFFGH